MRNVTLLGATGSIGDSTLDVIARHPDRFAVAALAAHRNGRSSRELCRRFRPRVRGAARSRRPRARSKRRSRATACRRACSPAPAGSSEVAALPEVDTVLAAIVGAAGLAPDARGGARRQAHPARQQGSAGDRRRALHARGRARAARRCCRSTASTTRSSSACRRGYAREPRAAGVRRILLTASGGPFRDAPLDEARRGHAGRGLRASELGDGPQDLASTPRR